MIMSEARRSDGLHVPIWEVAALVVLVLFYFFFGMDDEADELVNQIGPLALSVILLLGALQAAQREPAAVWMGLTWFRVSTAIYFGIGTIVHHHVNYETLIQIINFYRASPEQIATFNMINAVSCLLVLGTAAVLARLFPTDPTGRSRTSDDGRLLLTIALLTSLCGFSAKFLIAVPISLGLLRQDAVPGIVAAFEYFAFPAVFLWTLWCLRFAPRFIPLVVLLVAVTAGIGFLRFIKSEVILPPLMLALALLYHKSSALRLAACAGAVIVLYQVVVEPVAFGRFRLGQIYGASSSVTLEERFSFLADYYENGASSMPGSNIQGSVARIAYAHSAAPAISFYERGIYGESLKDALVVFIPRALWPDKPVFDHGLRYNEMINGSTSSSAWMGYFVEAYWNLGWLGVVVVMIPMGAAFFAFGRYTQFVMYQESWLHFPMVFMGMYLGVRVDGSLVTEFLVTCVIALLYHFFGSVASTCIEVFIAARRSLPGALQNLEPRNRTRHH